MARTAKFWDGIAERYSKQPIADEASYQRKLEVTRTYLHSDMDVLEFGCGTGSTAILHAPYVKQIKAVDVSEKMLEIARTKSAAENIDNITFEQAAIEDFEVSESSFDVVLGLSILHLLEDKEAAIAKVYRMLKPGGLFITSTVCLGDFMTWFAPIAAIGHFFGLLPIIKVIKAQELTDAFLTANFELEYQWQPAKNKAIFIVAKKSLK